MCGMQFTNIYRTRVRKRPLCAVCGSAMYLYSYDYTTIRFRCARYPECKTYVKIPKKEAI